MAWRQDASAFVPDATDTHTQSHTHAPSHEPSPFEAFLDDDSLYIEAARTDARPVPTGTGTSLDDVARLLGGPGGLCFDVIFDVPCDPTQLELPVSERACVQVRAHRVIMAAGSPVLQGLLFNGMSESRFARLRVTECSIRPFLVVRKWLYTHTHSHTHARTHAIDIPQDIIVAVRAAANFYLLPELESHAQKLAYDIIHGGVTGALQIIREIAVGNESLIAANADLLELAMTRVFFSGTASLRSEAFVDLPVAALRAVIAADDLAADEQEVLDACIAWGRAALARTGQAGDTSTWPLPPARNRSNTRSEGGDAVMASPLTRVLRDTRRISVHEARDGGSGTRATSSGAHTRASPSEGMNRSEPSSGDRNRPRWRSFAEDLFSALPTLSSPSAAPSRRGSTHAGTRQRSRSGTATGLHAPGWSSPPAEDDAMMAALGGHVAPGSAYGVAGSASSALAFASNVHHGSRAASPGMTADEYARYNAHSPGLAVSLLTVAALDAIADQSQPEDAIHELFRNIMRPVLPFIRWGRLSMDRIASAVLEHHVLTREELHHLIMPAGARRPPGAPRSSADATPASAGGAAASSYIRGVLDEMAERSHGLSTLQAVAQLSAEASTASMSRKSSSADREKPTTTQGAAAQPSAAQRESFAPTGSTGAEYRTASGKPAPPRRPSTSDQPMRPRPPPPKRPSGSSSSPGKPASHPPAPGSDGRGKSFGSQFDLEDPVDAPAEEDEECVTLTAAPRATVKELRTSLEWHYNLRAPPLVAEDSVPLRLENETLVLGGILPRPTRCSGPPDGFKYNRCGVWNDAEPDAEPALLAGVIILAAEWQFMIRAAAPGSSYLVGYCEQPGPDPTTVRKVGVYSSGHVCRGGVLGLDERDAPERMQGMESLQSGDIVHFICRPALLTIDAFVNGRKVATFEQRTDRWIYPMMQVFGDDAYTRIAVQFYRLIVRPEC